MPHASPEARKKYLSEWYKKNRRKVIEKVKRWKRINGVRRREWAKEWRAKNKTHIAAQSKRWRNDNPERYNAIVAKQRERGAFAMAAKRYRQKVPDKYVLQCIVHHSKILEKTDIPAAMIDAKRAEIILKRKLKGIYK